MIKISSSVIRVNDEIMSFNMVYECLSVIEMSFQKPSTHWNDCEFDVRLHDVELICSVRSLSPAAAP